MTYQDAPFAPGDAQPTISLSRRDLAKAAGATGAGGGGLARTGGIMALGTIASRATGFLRTVALAAAIGTGALGDGYNVANTTPNILYDLLLGGVLTSVIVPVLVRASKEDADGGEAFTSSLLTLIFLLLGVAVAVGLLAAPLIIKVYLAGDVPGQADLATTFLRWFLPQILFYGVGATIGAVLNVRRSFAAPMFTPVLNNLVVIGVCIGFVYLLKPRPPTVATITGTQTTLLAVGTTAGVVVMTVALLPSLAKVGFRYRPRLDLRNPRLLTALRLAGWTFLFVAVSQAGYVVVVRLGTAGTAYTVYSYGYIIFQLPYAIIGVSVITALLPRMSGHAADGRPDLVREDLGEGIRTAMVAILPAALFLLALGRPIAVTVFQHGAVGAADATAIGDTISAFAVALVPFSMFQLQLRAFYAHQDTRTPALTSIAIVASNIAAAALLAEIVPAEHRAVALALAFCLAYLVGVVITSALLRRRLGGIDGHQTIRLMTRVALAAGVGAVLASALAAAVRSLVGDGWIGSGLALVLAVGLGGWVFGLVASRMGITELTSLTGSVFGRLGSVGRRLRPQKS